MILIFLFSVSYFDDLKYLNYNCCSICSNADNWSLMSKYSKKFVKAGVKLRQSSFDVWMEFASRIGI